MKLSLYRPHSRSFASSFILSHDEMSRNMYIYVQRKKIRENKNKNERELHEYPKTCNLNGKKKNLLYSCNDVTYCS